MKQKNKKITFSVFAISFLLAGFFNLGSVPKAHAACTITLRLTTDQNTLPANSTSPLKLTGKVNIAGSLADCNASKVTMYFGYLYTGSGINNGTAQSLHTENITISNRLTDSASYTIPNFAAFYKSAGGNLNNPGAISFRLAATALNVAGDITDSVTPFTVSGILGGNNNFSLRTFSLGDKTLDKPTYNQNDQLQVVINSASQQISTLPSSGNVVVKIYPNQNWANNSVLETVDVGTIQGKSLYSYPPMVISAANGFVTGLNTITVELWPETNAQALYAKANITIDAGNLGTSGGPSGAATLGPKCAYDSDCSTGQMCDIEDPTSNTYHNTYQHCIASTTPSTQTGPAGGSDKLYNPLPESDLTHAFLVIAQGLLAILGVFAVVFIIVGGFQMLVAAGNEEALMKAKKTIIWAVLGLVVALLSFSIIAIVQDILQVNIKPASTSQNTTQYKNV